MAETVPSLLFNNGTQVPMLGLGTSQFVRKGAGAVPNLRGTRAAVEDAIDIGYRHFDTAYVYENEREVGLAIKTKLDQQVVKREDLFVVTKLWNTYHHPTRVLQNLRQSLENLQLSYVDCYLIHSPVGQKFTDEDTLNPIDEKGNLLFERTDHMEIWKELEKAVDLGLTKSIGLSNFNQKQIQHILDGCRIKPATLQVESHAYLMQNELFDFCQKNQITVTAFAPIGSPGRWCFDPQDPVLVQDPVVIDIAKKHGKVSSQILIRYLIERGRLAIPRTTQKQHLLENFQIFDFNFTEEDLRQLDGLNKNIRYFVMAATSGSADYQFK